MENETQSLLPKNRSSNPSYSTPEGLELRSFRLGLNWFCLDQSNLWKVSLSWSFFFVLAIGVPIISHYVLLCSNCDEKHRRPYDAVVQLSLSSFAAVSFISLSSWARKYGIRKFLFLDKLCDVSDKVRKGYAEELQVCVFFSMDGSVKLISNSLISDHLFVVYQFFDVSLLMNFGSCRGF